MPIFESLVALLTSSTAKSIGKYLYQKIDGYLRSRYETIPAEEKVALEKKIEELKRINDEIKNKTETDTEVTQDEVYHLKQKVDEIEGLQKKKELPEVLISPELFQEWIRGEDIEDRAFVAKRELDVVIDKARKMGAKQRKLWDLEDISNRLVMHVDSLREARRELRKDPNRFTAQQKEMEAKIAIDNNLGLAKEALDEWKKMGR